MLVGCENLTLEESSSLCRSVLPTEWEDMLAHKDQKGWSSVSPSADPVVSAAYALLLHPWVSDPSAWCEEPCVLYDKDPSVAL